MDRHRPCFRLDARMSTQVGMTKAMRAYGSTKASPERGQRAQKENNVAKTKQEHKRAQMLILVKLTTCSGTGSKRID